MDLAAGDLGVPDWAMMANDPPAEVPALALLDFPLSESLQGAFEQVFGDPCRGVVLAQWCINWEGWTELVDDVTAMRAAGEDTMSVVILDRIAAALRRFVRLVLQNNEAAVVWRSDAEATRSLRQEQGLYKGYGLIHGNNECCADSLLQHLRAQEFLLPLSTDERQEACKANRTHLVSHPDARLRPRRRDAFSGMDLGVDPGAFLQHDLHAEPILKFFMEFFHSRLQRAVPAGGIRIVVHSRFDSHQIPPTTMTVCQEDMVSEDYLTMHMYNLTGDGIHGESL